MKKLTKKLPFVIASLIGGLVFWGAFGQLPNSLNDREAGKFVQFTDGSIGLRGTASPLGAVAGIPTNKSLQTLEFEKFTTNGAGDIAYHIALDGDGSGLTNIAAGGIVCQNVVLIEEGDDVFTKLLSTTNDTAYLFCPGTHTLTNNYFMNSGESLVGFSRDNTIINQANNASIAFTAVATTRDNINVANLTFDGLGSFFRNNGKATNNFTVQNCRFKGTLNLFLVVDNPAEIALNKGVFSNVLFEDTTNTFGKDAAATQDYTFFDVQLVREESFPDCDINAGRFADFRNFEPITTTRAQQFIIDGITMFDGVLDGTAIAGAIMSPVNDGGFLRYDNGLADGVQAVPGYAILFSDGVITDTRLFFQAARFDVTNATLTAGNIVYVSETIAGDVTDTAPSGSGEIVQQIGIAVDANTVQFNIGDFTTITVP